MIGCQIQVSVGEIELVANRQVAVKGLRPPWLRQVYVFQLINTISIALLRETQRVAVDKIYIIIRVVAGGDNILRGSFIGSEVVCVFLGDNNIEPRFNIAVTLVYSVLYQLTGDFI